MTALMIANNTGNYTFYQQLVRNGALKNVLTLQGDTEVHVAAQGNQVSNLLRLIVEINQTYQKTVEKGLDPKGRELQDALSHKNIDGLTPLHLAAKSGSTQCV